MIFNILISIFGIASAIHMMPYAKEEYTVKKNKLGSVIIVLIALTSVFLSIYQNFV